MYTNAPPVQIYKYTTAQKVLTSMLMSMYVYTVYS